MQQIILFGCLPNKLASDVRRLLRGRVLRVVREHDSRARHRGGLEDGDAEGDGERNLAITTLQGGAEKYDESKVRARAEL